MSTPSNTPPFDPCDCKNTEEHLAQLRKLVSDLSWGEVMYHVAGIMAEQADKTLGDQSSALFACSNTIRALSSFFMGCGSYEYPKGMLPKEDHSDQFHQGYLKALESAIATVKSDQSKREELLETEPDMVVRDALQAGVRVVTRVIEDLRGLMKQSWVEDPPSWLRDDPTKAAIIWSVLNQERGRLINKVANGTIGTEDRGRLVTLNEYADYYMNKVAPRPHVPDDPEWIMSNHEEKEEEV